MSLLLQSEDRNALVSRYSMPHLSDMLLFLALFKLIYDLLTHISAVVSPAMTRILSTIAGKQSYSHISTLGCVAPHPIGPRYYDPNPQYLLSLRPQTLFLLSLLTSLLSKFRMFLVKNKG